MSAHVWSCPSCGRRVPMRVVSCHCGMSRERAEELAAAADAPPPRASPARRLPRSPREPLPPDVKLLVAGLAVVALTAVGTLIFRPWRPEPIAPVLGWMDASPSPQAKPTPAPSPPFKLPWWK